MKKVTGGALPAQAWHEFMVAAHEGVPVAALPGSWTPGSGAPDVAVDDQPAQQMDENTFPPAPKPAKQQVGAVNVRQDQPTASIGRPVPPADVGGGRPVPPGEVGGPTQRRETSILDVLLGN
jgi:penicillin-binding protein 1A